MVTVGIVLLFLTAPIRYLPLAVLGAVIIHAATGLIEPAKWRALADGSRRELLIAATTTIGVVTVGILQALVVAVVLSILDVVTRSSRPHDAVLGYVPRLGRWADVRLHPGAVLEPGVLVYRLDDRLFFANANYVQGRIREAVAGAPDDITWVVFDAESLVSIDSTGIEALALLIGELDHRGVHFAVARARGRVVELLESSGLADRIGRDRLYTTVAAAVAGTSGSPAR
jgi:MFS superfamily sulfate permease-like transporter